MADAYNKAIGQVTLRSLLDNMAMIPGAGDVISGGLGLYDLGAGVAKDAKAAQEQDPRKMIRGMAKNEDYNSAAMNLASIAPFLTPAVLGMAKGKGIKEALQYDKVKMATQYPDTLPGVPAVDKKTGKEFIQKNNSPEALAVQAAREAARKDIEAGNYTPYFNVADRHYADFSKYGTTGRTITDAMPKKQATIDKYKAMFDTPEARERLTLAFLKGNADPNAVDWYAMGQLEDAFIKELGPEAGRAAFKTDFADAMAATTGGANPTDNLLMAHYGNFMRNAGKPLPKAAHEMPFPIGGRYASGNMEMYDKVINQGKGLSASGTPKRFDFSSNFLGNREAATIDEQMSRGFQPGLNAPPGDSYGIFEGVVHDLARKHGVSPANFQDATWAGLKGTPGKSMMQHVNEMIERTSRITGKSPDEVLKGYINKTMPMYSATPISLGLLYGMDQEQR